MYVCMYVTNEILGVKLEKRRLVYVGATQKNDYRSNFCCELVNNF